MTRRRPKDATTTHAQLVGHAVRWLRAYRCGVVLAEQSCDTGETPDAIGWKRRCHSVLVECKTSRADFLADRDKPWRKDPARALGCERFYLAPAGLLDPDELPRGWGLLECKGRSVAMVAKSTKNLRTDDGFRSEMNLLLASLVRVEKRIEPQRITEFLQWKNRLAEYNGGRLPAGVLSGLDEGNPYLDSAGTETTEVEE